MENVRIVSFYTAAILLFLAAPLPALGYVPDTTHKALTQESIQFFEIFYDINVFSEREAEHIIAGGAAEDSPVYRPLFHFYDPIYNRGIRGNASAKTWAVGTDLQAQFDISYTAKAGGVLGEKFAATSDYSWERAVYEYVHGDKVRGLKTLGHILHLVQDASVPAHTRGDAHPPYFNEVTDQASVYEGWTSRFTRGNIQTTDALISNAETPYRYSTIGKHLDTLAYFTNTNFFSKDTVFDTDYESPNIDQEKEENLGDSSSVLYGYTNIGNDEIKNIQINRLRNERTGEKETEYIFDDEKNLIQKEQWNILSKEAVRHGAGVIALFFKHVAEEKETQALKKENRSFVQKIQEETTAGLYNVADALYGSSVSIEDIEDENEAGGEIQEIVAQKIENAETQDAEEEVAITTDVENTENARSEEIQESNNTQQESIPDNQTETQEQQQTPMEENSADGEKPQNTENNTTQENSESETTNIPEPPAIVLPGGAPVGGGANNESAGENTNTDSSVDTVEDTGTDTATSTEDGDEESKDTTPPGVPVVSKPIPGYISTSTHVTFSGSAEATSTIAFSYTKSGSQKVATTTASTTGNWHSSLTLGTGTTTVSITATDDAQNTSAATSTTLFIDSGDVPINLSSPTCSTKSFGENECVVATTTLAFEWRSSDNDISHFQIAKNGLFATTTATTTLATTTDGSAYTFAVKAIDTRGNSSATTSIAVHAETKPVVINEIAWMGTASSSDDEWIELYNTTQKEIDLSTWEINTADDGPKIPLSGKMNAGAYYILERTDDETIADISANRVYGNDAPEWALNNSGESISLIHVHKHGTTTVDKIDNENGWFAGVNTDADTRYTQERYAADGESNAERNWSTAAANFFKNGTAASGDAINGTPRARNGISYKIANGKELKSDKTLKSDTTYFVGKDGLKIQSGATLTIPEGVIIKTVTAGDPRIQVSGNLITHGTQNKPVIFTSFFDDARGGDFNSDGRCQPGTASTTPACPAPGDWGQIEIGQSSTSTHLTHTQFYYGGGDTNGSQVEKAAVLVSDTNVFAEKIKIEGSGHHGIGLENSSSTIENSTFSRNSTNGQSAGVYVSGGAPKIKDSVFLGNSYGTRISISQAQFLENTFTDNLLTAIDMIGTQTIFKDNAGSGNGENAINLASFITKQGTTTLHANALPYTIESQLQVTASSTLKFEKEGIIKGESGSRIVVQHGGFIKSNTADSSDVVFTSIFDDSTGATVDTSVTTDPSAGDWVGIVVESGGGLDMSGFTMQYAGEGGGSDEASIHITSGTGTSTISHARITQNRGAGVYAESDATLSITDTEISEHTKIAGLPGKEAGISLDGSSGTFADISFLNNQMDIRGVNGASASCTKCGTPTTTPPGLLP